jgi:hypothetical protein
MAFTLNMNIYYRIFFLYVEPLSALAGAIAATLPSTYLALLDPKTNHHVVNLVGQTPAVGTVINQLANLYLYFSLTEALVLRAAGNNLSVWRALVFTMLIADFGHLAAGWRLGYEQYWQANLWGAMEMGGIGFVYAGAATRIAFLSGIGIREVQHVKKDN